MKELKRDLHRMKKDAVHGAGFKPGKEEKGEIKRELKGVKREVRERVKGVRKEAKERVREVKREKRDVKREMVGKERELRREQRERRRGDRNIYAYGEKGEKRGDDEGQETGITKV